MANLVLPPSDDRSDAGRPGVDRRLRAGRWPIGRWIATLGMAIVAAAVVVGTLESGHRTRAGRVEAATPEAAVGATTTKQPASSIVATAPTTIDLPPPGEPAEITAPVQPPNALWPPSFYARRYRDPEALARSFATEYIGFTAPVVGRFRAIDAHSGEVDIRADDEGPVTVVYVARLPADPSWWAVGAGSGHIVVAEPTPGSTVVGPLRYSGEALVSSGLIEVEIRGSRVDRPLASTEFSTGGGEELHSFEGLLGRPPADRVAGAAVFLTRASVSGEVLEATVIPALFLGSDDR